MLRDLIFALVLVAACMACAANRDEPSPRPPGFVDVVSGGALRPLSGAAGEVRVVVFSSTDCPIANSLAGEIERIHQDTANRGGRLMLVHARTDLDPVEAAFHARDYGLSMPVLIDHDLALTAELGATVTPEAVVLRFTAADRWTLVYRGRINDLYVSLGRRRATSGSDDLRRAIDAAFANRPIDFVPVQAVGCRIEGT